MRSVCDDKCFFVHIGGNCDLDREMDAFEKKVFQPTEIEPTTHHFTTTEVFQLQNDEWKMIQFTFTALVH